MEMATFDNAAKHIRKQISNFETASLIGELIKYLQQTPEMKRKGEISAPWVVLLAIDWVLELHPSSGKYNATQKDVHNILNNIWRTQHIAVDSESSPISVQIRALLAPQVIFQRSAKRMAYFFLRMKKIISADKENSALFEKCFFGRYRLNLETFYEITFIICIYSMNEKTKFFNFSFFVECIMPYYKLSDVANTINILASTVSDLVNKAEKDIDREVPKKEYFRESLFLETPFLLMESGLLVIHPTVVMIGISECIIRRFIREDEQNRTLFTKCFEEYLNEIHEEFNVASLRESELKSFYKEKSAENRKVVDFLLLSEDFNVFLDAKGVDPTNPILSAVTRHDISRRIKGQHLKAIRQIIDTIDVLITHNHKEIRSLDNRYGLVVTNQDFFLGTGDRILSFISDDLNQELINLAENKILFSNIHFMTVEQYEILNCILSETGKTFKDFFEYVKDCERDSHKIKLVMDQYIESFSISAYEKPVIPNGAPSLIADKDRMFDFALKVLSSNHAFWQKVGKTGDLGIEYFMQQHNKLVRSTFHKDRNQKGQSH
ncbi:MAG: hypothetical protein LPK11_11520 [Chromatiaceae bacterium]|nr:hypothetical protein [Chromatiaceae bacterium]